MSGSRSGQTNLIQDILYNLENQEGEFAFHNLKEWAFFATKSDGSVR